MSEFSQGSGWWLAADGKWYPPQLHPSMGPPPPPPPSSMFQASAVMTPVAPSAPWRPVASGGIAGAAGWAPPVAGEVDPVLGLRLAPWWKRLVALIIDNLILGLGVFFVVLIIGIAANGSGSQNGNSGSSSSHGAALLAGLLIIWVLVSIPVGLYFAIMNGSRRGQTVGKMALSIAVRDARTGARVGFWRAFGRFMITVVFTILLYIPYLIDSLAPLWDKRNQSWHDKVAHTVVVDLKP